MTIKDKLLQLVREKKMYQYTVDCILLEVNPNKLVDDLSKYEKDLIDLYLKQFEKINQ
jgi:hypothetical protein